MKLKDAGLRIRVERNLRDQFLAVCRAQDRPAAQVLRHFMRQYVAEHGNGEGEALGSLPPNEGGAPQAPRSEAEKPEP